MKKPTGIFILILFSFISFSASGYKTTKDPGINLSKNQIIQNNILIEQLFKDSVTENKEKIEKLDTYTDLSDIPEEVLQSAYFSYLLLNIKYKTTKYEILEIHYFSPENAFVLLKITVPDIDLLTGSKDFNDFIDKRLNERLKEAYSSNIENFSDREINELYFLTFIVISEAVLEYAPEIKDFKSRNIGIQLEKVANVWILDDSIYNYTEIKNIFGFLNF
jgi:hypothetical protein